MNRTALAIVLIAAALSPAFAQTAEEIVATARDRIQADTISTRSRMVIQDKDGSTTERLVDQYTSKTKGGGDKTMIVFQKPASVAGTRFLTVENEGKADDRWIFLPSLGKVRRIAASEGSGSFMGTDLSYDDVSSADRDADEDTHALLREEALEGKACWVIESRPKDSGYQYGKMVSWIEKDSSIAKKIEMYDRKGQLVKVLETGAVENVQGRLTAKQTKMSSVQEKTSTTISVEIIKYDDKIPDSVFTTRFLETGRP